MYDALVEAGASQEKARKAAESVAGFYSRVLSIDQKVTAVQGEVLLLKWMTVFGLALSVTNLLKLFV